MLSLRRFGHVKNWRAKSNSRDTGKSGGKHYSVELLILKLR